MPHGNDGEGEPDLRGYVPEDIQPDGDGNSIVSGLDPSLERRTFLKGSGALAASAGLANAHANVEENGNVGDVPEEPEDGQVRHFEVHAIDVDIVFNRYGLHQPVGVMYALEEDIDEIREVSGKIPCGNNVVFDDEDEEFFCEDIPEEDRGDQDTRLIQPLTLRANRGDVIEIEFHNDLDRHASIHQTSLPYEVEESDGMDVGFNPNTTVAPGESITYRWFASHFGTHFFLDGANQAVDSAEEPPQIANLLARGLFGSVNVLPRGTTWSDPFTGEVGVQGRVQADIHLPDDLPEEAIVEGNLAGESFRQLHVYYHTPEGIVTADGDQLTFPDSDEPQPVHAINYRADPTGSRIPALDTDDSELEEAFYNSWLHGDPGGGDNVYPMYLGDPVKTIAVGASHEENHVHHLHGHRWKEIPPTEDSDTIDSQTVGLGAVYEQPIVPAFGTPTAAINDFDTVRPDAEFEEMFQVGAGGAHGSPGDYLFHCHLFPHYGEGMWGIMRVLDKEQERLKKLPTNEPPLPADSDIPGYPEFIPGEFGETPPFPPYGAAGLDDFRDPTPAEREALTREGDILPGAPYTDPCDPDVADVEPAFEGELREYTIVALPADIVYNDAGHHDPNGIVFVLEEDADLVKEGKINPEPLVIRANVGDCVEITLKNEVTEENIAALPGDRFPDDDADQSVPIEAGGKSNHIHFVSYDVLGSDSLATGFNYRQDAQPDEEMPYRWYADEEGTIFFHDHITGIEDIMHGSFASLVVEPRDSEWLDPYSGEPIRSGTQAIIEDPNGDDFREFAVAYHDFAQLLDRDGELVNEDEEHNENAGVMAINYRNAPYYIREDEDPAYVHSSFVHGDPSTPVFEAYEDDPVRFRVWQATYEEQHNFTLHSRRFEPEGLDPEDAITQVMGTSESFTMDVLPEAEFEEEGDGAAADGGTDVHAKSVQVGDSSLVLEHDHETGRHEVRVEDVEDLTVNPAGLPIRDHLYGSTIVDDLWDGMWGIFRTFGAEVDHLAPLPDRGAPDGEIDEAELKEMGHPAPHSDFDWSEVGQKARLLYGEDDDRDFPADRDARNNPAIPEEAPPLPPTPGDPCPADAPVREVDVSAFTTTIEYNDHGDQDPFGIVYAIDEHAEDMRNGDRPVEPLTLRANVGDCIEVTLTNDVDFDEIDDDHPHPEMRTGEEDLGIEWERSERISLHPTRIANNVLASSGATVGFNWDQTIGPGESITYRWFADEDIGSVVLYDHADVRSNRHHGAFGRLIVEPEGTEFVAQTTAEPLPNGEAASLMLKMADGDDEREFALAFADSQFIVNEDEDAPCVVPPGPDIEEEDEPCNQLGDPEDQGYPGINYRSEPFIRRFEEDPDIWEVYDSEEHGDPATPIPRALLGDPVSFRVHKTADKARGVSFHLSDHQWNRFRDIDESENIGVDDRFTVGKSDRIEPFGGAGGLAESTGDFIYQELKMRRRLEGGFWGIFRVRNDLHDFEHLMQPLPDKADGMPLDKRPGWVPVWGDLTGDGTKDLIVVVPESERGRVHASALYVFLGPVDEHSMTDLTGADIEVMGTLHDGEHDHGTVTVWLNDDLGVDSVDTLVGLLTDTTVTVEDCKSMTDWLAGTDGLEDALSALDLEAGDTRSGDVSVTLAESGDTGEVSLAATATDVDGDGSHELTLTVEGGPRIVVKGCGSLLG